MNQEEFNSKRDNYIAQMKELEKQTKPNGPTVYFTTNDVREKMASGGMPEELGNWYISFINRQNQISIAWRAQLKENPNISGEELLTRLMNLGKALSFDDMLQNLEANLNIARIYQYFAGNGTNIEESAAIKSPEKQGDKKLFKNIDHEDYFGVSYGIANALYYLIDLLKLELKQNEKNLGYWIAEGKVENSQGLSLSLEYEFRAATKQEALKIVEEYKAIMKTKGIKTLMAYWLLANEYGSREFTCPFIEILKTMSNEDRTAKFDPDERQKYWNITKTLSKTIIKKEVIQKGKRIWQQVPLITILGGERAQDEKYPLQVSVCVPNVGPKTFAPTLYHKNTLKTHPSDTHLAVFFQTRAGQVYPEKESCFTLLSLFELGNLSKTATTNKREAKAKIKRKLNDFQKMDIIGGHKEAKAGIKIRHSEVKRKGEVR